MMRRIFVWSLSCLILAAPGLVRADGVTDFVIDPATGYTIDKPGSYRLAADVTMTNPVVNAVAISAANVTVDLNGHTIDGGSPDSGLGDGVFSNGNGTVVRNGRIRAFRDNGVSLSGPRSRVCEIEVSACVTGISLTGYGGIVENCIASNNTRTTAGNVTGISVSNRVTVRDCVASENVAPNGNAYGIYAANYCIITGNQASYNISSAGGNGIGIYSGYGGQIRGNTCSDNKGPGGGYGISSSGYAIIDGNSCDANQGTGNGNGRGISASSYARIVNNICTDNEGAGTGTSVGIDCSASSVVANNHCGSHSNGSAGYGILVNGGGSVIRDNTTADNATAGIRLASGNNRCFLNNGPEPTAVSDIGGNSLGAGDLANVSF